MKKPYRGMTPALTLLTTFLDNGGLKPVSDLDLDGIREARAERFPERAPFSWIRGRVDPSVTITTASATARDGVSIPLRVYVPHAPTTLPMVCHFHGGGWVLGSPAQHDPLCSHLAATVPAVVVSVDYRLAPEHPAPTAAYDCIDATGWVRDEAATFGGDGSRLAVCGDSAGGNLATIVAQAFRDAGDRSIRHQALLYPGLDMTMSSPSVREHANAPLLTKTSMDTFRDLYLGAEPALELTDPLVSPLFGRLDGLPPALVQTADLDPLRDEGEEYAVRLAAAGVPARHTNYVGVPHGFASFPGATRIGRQHRAELVAELRKHLRPDTPTS